MHATYVPDPAGRGGVADVVDAERVVVTATADTGTGGELTVYLRDGQHLHAALTPAQLRAVLHRWGEAARDGLGHLLVRD
jgi:hypothetical protein